MIIKYYLDKYKNIDIKKFIDIKYKYKKIQNMNIFIEYFLCVFQLLEDLASQQIQLEQELEKVQQERDTNRARLLSYIYNGTILSFSP